MLWYHAVRKELFLFKIYRTLLKAIILSVPLTTSHTKRKCP